jgi:hypothetical protein
MIDKVLVHLLFIGLVKKQRLMSQQEDDLEEEEVDSDDYKGDPTVLKGFGFWLNLYLPFENFGDLFFPPFYPNQMNLGFFLPHFI